MEGAERKRLSGRQKPSISWRNFREEKIPKEQTKVSER